MGLQSLGIDIGDSHVTGVVLEQQRRHLQLRGCLSLPVADGVDIPSQIRLLCQQLGWQGGGCVCGVPLSPLSIRNLTLPFQDAKKIAQILPFELEEQLLTPIEALVTDFTVSKKSDTGTTVVSFSLERQYLQNLLAEVRDVIDPDIVTPAMAALANHLARHEKNRPDFLLVHVDIHAGALVLVLQGQPIFYRRLAFPEEMVLQSPFHFEADRVEITDAAAALEGIRRFGQAISRSLEYFQVDNREERRPERIILTGPLAEVPLFAETLQAELGLSIETVDLIAANTLSCPTELVQSQCRGQHFDRALALAMQGFKRTGINFRKEEFAKKRTVFTSRKQLFWALGGAAALAAGLFGYLGYDYHRLQQRDKALGEEMIAIYKKTFPGVTKVQDPLIEMRARMKSAQGPASPTLFLHNQQRILDLLADISARIPETVSVRVSRMTIDRDAVTLKGTTDTFNSVQTIKSSLAASPKFKSVQIVSATADKEKKKGTVRFEVQLQLEGI